MEKRTVPIRQTRKKNKFPYAWILITYMWIINMPHEPKWSTHVCKWATHRDYSHINFWRPNLAAAEVNTNISINLITLRVCQTHNKILQSYHYRTAFPKRQTRGQFSKPQTPKPILPATTISLTPSKVRTLARVHTLLKPPDFGSCSIPSNTHPIQRYRKISKLITCGKIHKGARLKHRCCQTR